MKLPWRTNGLRRTAHIAVVLVCLIACGTSAQSFAKNGTPLKGGSYANVDELLCGNEKVLIVSSCSARDRDNSDPYCFAQTVTFLGEKNRVARSYRFQYPVTSNSFVYSAACKASGTKNFIELGSSNLGNCSHCEWFDYFTASGIYIASSPVPNTERTFQRRILTKAQEQMVRTADVVQKIELTTVARKVPQP